MQTRGATEAPHAREAYMAKEGCAKSRSRRALSFLSFTAAVFHVVWTVATVRSTASDESRVDGFTVDSFLDETDAVPGDWVCASPSGACTLRAAIQEANASPGTDNITLPAGYYTLTIAGAGDNTAASGDLDITDNVAIRGAGSSVTVLDAGQIDRAFHQLAEVQPIDLFPQSYHVESVALFLRGLPRK